MITTTELDYHSMRHFRPNEKEKASHTGTCEMFGYDKIPIHVMKYATRTDATVNNITYQEAIANRIIAMDEIESLPFQQINPRLSLFATSISWGKGNVLLLFRNDQKLIATIASSAPDRQLIVQHTIVRNWDWISNLHCDVDIPHISKQWTSLFAKREIDILKKALTLVTPGTTTGDDSIYFVSLLTVNEMAQEKASTGRIGNYQLIPLITNDEVLQTLPAIQTNPEPTHLTDGQRIIATDQ